MFRGAAAAIAMIVMSACVSAAEEGPQYVPLRINGENVRWFPRERGNVSLTYAIADRSSITPEATNCRKMRAPSRVLSGASVTLDRFRTVLREAFTSWERAADISFAETPDTARADILIGEQSEPNGYAFSSVLPGPRTGQGFREIIKGAVCFNPERRWKDGIGGDAGIYDLTYTLRHEIGHIIGLDHPSRRGHLMSFRYSEELRDLTAGDAAGAAYVYGPPPPPRDFVLRARASLSSYR